MILLNEFFKQKLYIININNCDEEYYIYDIFIYEYMKEVIGGENEKE